ncbi:hypothetical protein GCM10020219_037690 [Nonomuraea dietziae]
MTDLDARLRAVLDLNQADARESGGRHEYDGRVQDLSPEGVAAALARVGEGPAPADPYDAAHLEVFEGAAKVVFGELQLHRRNPLFHLSNLDLACYDRDYAPAPEREAAKTAHLARWPEAVEHAISSLDAVAAPVATSLLGAVKGLAAGVTDDDALKAHARLVAHVERGPPRSATPTRRSAARRWPG